MASPSEINIRIIIISGYLYATLFSNQHKAMFSVNIYNRYHLANEIHLDI